MTWNDLSDGAKKIVNEVTAPWAAALDTAQVAELIDKNGGSMSAAETIVYLSQIRAQGNNVAYRPKQ